MADLRIDVEVNQADIRAVSKMLRNIAGGSQKAVSSSINRALEHGRTLVKKEVMAEVNVSQKAVLRSMKIQKASPDKLSGMIRVSRFPIPLGEYKPRRVAEGVQVKVRKSRGAETIKHAFIATMRSGHVGVFVRRPGSKHQTVMRNGKRRSTQLPIDEKYGPTVAGVLAGKPGVIGRIRAAMSAAFTTHLYGQVKRFIAE